MFLTFYSGIGMESSYSKRAFQNQLYTAHDTSMYRFSFKSMSKNYISILILSKSDRDREADKQNNTKKNSLAKIEGGI